MQPSFLEGKVNNVRPLLPYKKQNKESGGTSAIVLVHPDRITVRKILTYNMMLMTLMAVISIAVYAHVFSFFFPYYLLKAISGYVIIFCGIQRCPLFCGRG